LVFFFNLFICQIYRIFFSFVLVTFVLFNLIVKDVE
jgi:hypothetical protein